MRNDSKNFNKLICFYIECTPEKIKEVQCHFLSIAQFHHIEPLWAMRIIEDECVMSRKIYYVTLALRKSALSRHHSTKNLQLLFEADIKLLQQSEIVYEVEFLTEDQI
jgi:hypothetical protein